MTYTEKLRERLTEAFPEGNIENAVMKIPCCVCPVTFFGHKAIFTDCKKKSCYTCWNREIEEV